MTRTLEDGDRDDEQDYDKDVTNDTGGVPCSVPCSSRPLPGPLPTVHLNEKKAKEDTETYEEATSMLRRLLNKYEEGKNRHGPERRMRLREGPNGAAGDHVAGLPLSQIHIGTDQKNTIFALFWPENASN